MADKPSISVIVPVFNSEKYVSNTIKSVLRQPFSKEKYEIILINDHSSDNSKLIIQNFKKKFKNIKVINNKKITKYPIAEILVSKVLWANILFFWIATMS